MNPEDHSKRTSPDEFVERLKTLITAQIAGSNQLLARFGHFVQEASKSVGNGAARERTDVQTMLSRWLDFNLASYSLMTSSSLTLLNGLITAAESTLIPKPERAPATEPSSRQRHEFSVSGRQGEKAATCFAIENNFALPLTVNLESDQLVSQSGQALDGSRVNFEPATIVIPPNGQAVVQAIVSITSEFIIGETYTTTIRLLGSETKEIGLSVTILPPIRGVEPPPRPSKSAKRRKGRT